MFKRNQLLLIFTFILLTFSITLFAQQIQFEKQDSLELITDGPYIFWEDSKAIIKYVLDNNLVSEEITVQDMGAFTFELEGFDHDFEISSYPPTIYPSSYSDVSKIFVLSDIHGQYDRFVEILQGNRVIDANLDWAWGDGHLVILGDVLDRGPKVTECLWLIHKLEIQAEQWRGKVHYLLGNHEVMVMQGDIRYVHDKYKKVADIMKMDVQKLFVAYSEFGRWLRSKHTIIKINDIMFVHAGINPHVAYRDYDIRDINDRIRINIDSPPDKIKYSEYLNFLFGNDGPFWYRGYFKDTKTSQQIKLDDFLELIKELNVTAIVVGHTTQDFINPFFKDKLIPVDTGIKYGNKGEGLFWENGIFYRAKVDGYHEQITFP